MCNESNRAIVHSFLHGAGPEKINAVGNFERVYRNLRNERSKMVNPQPIIYPRLGIASLLARTHLNEQFYRHGPDNYGNHTVFDDIIIFYSDGLMESLG